MPKFSQSFVVGKEHLDEQNHVNNVTFVQWVQDVALAHWISETNEEIRQKYCWIMLRHEIEYKKQAFENEHLTAYTWVGEWSKVTCERFVEIFRNDDLLIKSKTTWCFLDKQNMKPTRIQEDLIKLF